MTYANGEVIVQVQVTGGTPAAVQLLRNGVAWQEISAPFRYTWGTSPDPDGDYALTAKAMVAGSLLTSAAVTVTVDHTPPTVTGLTPAPGSAAVDATEPLKVTFSEPIVPATITNASVKLTAGGTSLAPTVVLAPDGMSLAVTVADRSSVNLPALFAGTLAANLTDRAGNALAPLGSPWTWTVPAWIKLPAQPTDMPPRLAMGVDRRPVIIYVTLALVGGAYVYDLKLARYDGTQWDISMGAPSATRDTARNGYSLALDSKGQPVAAWTEPGSGQVDVHVGAWTGTAWNGLPALSAVNDASRDALSPSVQVDASDRPVVAWKEITSSAGAEDFFVAHWTGSTWAALNGTGVAGGVGLSQILGGPQLMLDLQGNPVFGWLVGGGMGSGVAIWTGTGWTISQGLIGGFTPYPVRDANGAPLIAVKSTDLHVMKWISSSANWMEAVPTTLTPSSSWNAPRLALAPDGSPVVAWLDTSAGVRLGLARWTGAAWDTRFGLFNAGQNPLNTIVPELVVDARGSVWVAWMEGTAVQVWMSNY